VSIDPVIPHALSGLKVRTRLCGHDVEVTYQVGPAGCGVSSVLVNGEGLAMTRDANPYRLGAARIAMTDLAAQLHAGPNAIVVHLG
jgi:cellobiose phosphorylase